MFTIDEEKNKCKIDSILDENCKDNIKKIVSNPVNAVEEKYMKRSRRWFLKIIQSPWFERVSMFVIIFNCITLGIYKPCEDQLKCASTRCFILEYLDHAIYVFFLIEMLIKILAMGFIGKNTYLAESWNILDFFIVLER